MIEAIDDFMTKYRYRRTFPQDEYMPVLAGFGVEYEPHRQHLTKTELFDLLLDRRLELMPEITVEEVSNGETIQEELDALVGSDLAASRS